MVIRHLAYSGRKNEPTDVPECPRASRRVPDIVTSRFLLTPRFTLKSRVVASECSAMFQGVPGM